VTQSSRERFYLNRTLTKPLRYDAFLPASGSTIIDYAHYYKDEVFVIAPGVVRVTSSRFVALVLNRQPVLTTGENYRVIQEYGC
jgi:hypothetical protein